MIVKALSHGTISLATCNAILLLGDVKLANTCYHHSSPIDLKIDNLDRVSTPTKIVATFDAEHPILGTTNEHPESVNSGKITSALHVFYLNLNLLAENSAYCSDTGIQPRMHALFRRHKWSQESGVRHQKWPRFL